MYKYLLFFILNTIFCVYAENLKTHNVELDYGSTNILHVRMIRKSILRFDKSIEKIQNYSKKTVDYRPDLFNLNIFNAYAANGDICIFGSWSSTYNGPLCSPSWISKTSTGSNEYQACKSTNKIKCAPIISGQNKCISSTTDYDKITETCERENLQSEVQEALKYFMDNKEELKNQVDLRKAYCGNLENQKLQNYESICLDFHRDISKIAKDINSDKVLEGLHALEASHQLRKAQDILRVCQKEYDDKQDSLWDEIFRSNRRTLDVIANTAFCSQHEISENMTLSQLVQDVADIDDNVHPKAIVKKAIDTSIELAIKNLLVTSQQFSDFIPRPLAGTDITDQLSSNRKKLSLQTLSNELSGELGNPQKHLMQEPYSKVINESIKQFENNRKNVKAFKAEEVLKSFNDFGDKINSICLKASNKYQEKVRQGQLETGTVFNSDAENTYYKEVQQELTKEYSSYTATDRLLASRLFSTPYFKENIFPFNESLGEKCSEGDLDGIAFQPVDHEDVKEALDSYQDLLYEDLTDVGMMAKDDKDDEYEDSLQYLLKYKPYLIGQYIKELDSPEDSKSLAKYICHESLDLYNNDEIWSGAKVTIGLIGMAVGPVLTFTGIGSPLGAAITTGAFTLVGSGAAILDYSEAIDIKRGAFLSRSSHAKNQLTIKDYALTLSIGDDNVTSAQFDLGFAFMEGGFFLRNLMKSNVLKVDTSSTDDAVASMQKSEIDELKELDEVQELEEIQEIDEAAELAEADNVKEVVKAPDTSSVTDANSAKDLYDSSLLNPTQLDVKQVDLLKYKKDPLWKTFKDSANYRSLSVIELNGKKVVAKKMGNYRQEMAAYEVLKKLGIQTPYKGVAKIDGEEYIIMKPIKKAVLMKADISQPQMSKETIAKLAKRVGPHTKKQLKQIQNILNEYGVETIDAQVLIDKKGNVHLFDPEHFSFTGQEIPKPRPFDNSHPNYDLFVRIHETEEGARRAISSTQAPFDFMANELPDSF